MLCAEDFEDFGELVLVQFESVCEELNAESEELAVVMSVKDGVLDVADQVFEEGSDHDVDDLDYFHVDL